MSQIIKLEDALYRRVPDRIQHRSTETCCIPDLIFALILIKTKSIHVASEMDLFNSIIDL